jgi:glycerol-3-phosphate dehydrogenase
MDRKKLLASIKPQYDVIVIGGGVNGAGLFRELALHNINVLMIDQADFSSQTSQSSSKMLHGGIRYLEQFDFGLVQEALEEKNLWLKHAPHLCQEKEFVLPVYKDSKYPLFMMKFALWMYDFLSHFRNKPHHMLTAEEVIQQFPEIKKEGLTGAGVYADAIVDDAKLTLECIYDGLVEENADAVNYISLVDYKEYVDHVALTLKPKENENQIKVKAKYVLFATGPFTDILLPKLGIHWEPQLALSKGIHLWLKPNAIGATGPMVLTTKDNRVVFVIPQRGGILVGTTETKVVEDMLNIEANQKEIDYLFGVLKEYFPGAALGAETLLSAFAGVRPLVRSPGAGNNLGKVSRHHHVYRPTHRSYALLGGKYTTFRKMCQSVNQELIPRLGLSYHPNLTLNSLRKRSISPTFEDHFVSKEDIQKICQTEYVFTKDDLLKRRLSLIQDTSKINNISGVDLSDLKL